MGMTAFMQRVEISYVRDRKKEGLPEDTSLTDPEKLREFLWKDFTEWFLMRRDVLLGEEWVKRGWADRVIESTDVCLTKDNYRVKPEAIDVIDAWLNDEFD